MRCIKGLLTAFSTYSILPVPAPQWDEDSLRYALAAFPLVGVFSGLCFFLWCWLCTWLGLGSSLFSAVGLLLLLGPTGGIHLDGFCDTVDALASHKSLPQKLLILSDPAVGAFAVMGCCGYLLFFFAVLTELSGSLRPLAALALVPAFARGLSAYNCAALPNAKGKGFLFSFTRESDVVSLKLTSTLISLLLLGAMWVISPYVFLGVVPLALLWQFTFQRLAMKEFGGITGDLAGFFLCLCELLCFSGGLISQLILKAVTL